MRITGKEIQNRSGMFQEIRDWKIHEFQDGGYQICPQTSGGNSSHCT